MAYVTNPIQNAKAQLAFRGILIKENNRQAKILDAMTKLEKVFIEIKEKR